jgi:predicted metal-dependent peptidase
MIIPLVIQINHPPYTRIGLTLISTVNVLNKHKSTNMHAVPTQGTGQVRCRCLRDEVLLWVLPSGALHRTDWQMVTISVVMLFALILNAPFKY